MPGVLDEGVEGVKAQKVRDYINLHGGTQDVKETLKQIKQIQDAGLSTFDMMAYKVGPGFGRRMGDAAFEYWVNNVLSGPSTMLVTNPVSNVVQMVASIFETGTAEIYGKFMRRGVVEGETLAHVGGLVDGYWEALSGAKKFWKGVQPGTRSKFMLGKQRAISAENFNLDPAGFVGKFADSVGKVLNYPTRVLSTQDVFFNMMHQRARINQLSHRMAIQAGHVPGEAGYISKVSEFRKNPTKGMIKESDRFGQEHTLTTPLGRDGGSGGQALLSLQQAMEKMPFGVGKFAGAFMRVGANLADRAIQRTPLTFLRAETRRNLMSKVPATVGEEIGKMTFGTGLLFGGGLLAHQGLITGSGPDDPKMQKALKSSGWQPNSIRLPGGNFIPTKDLGPLGIVLNMSADISELIGRIDSDDMERGHLPDESHYGRNSNHAFRDDSRVSPARGSGLILAY